MALGIDVYNRYQDVRDWHAVRAHGVRFVWVKLTDGGGLPGGGRNPGDAEVAGAKAAGIPVGGYHYAQKAPSPERQAEIFLGEVRRLGATDLVPMLDLEAPFVPDAAAKEFALRFCRRVEQLGLRPGVYLNNAFAKALRPDRWGITGLAIWLARYGARPDPAAGRYDVHQFASDGRVPGIVAEGVDLNESYTDNHFAGGSPSAPGGFEDMAFDSVFKTRYGQDLRVDDFMAWLDFRVNEIYSALFDPKQQSRIPGDTGKTCLNDATMDTVARVTITEQNVNELKAVVEKLAADVAELKNRAG
ncbi:glycoside hydrolase family 25 protein [Amycolatopsis cynarae]|uniref:Glycoside hydrolase family 25 protein n=1 Tax=Amycolatopsis cynarae TaxID=2995223 RepID=A0ABY7BBC4_9PSEU|nr:glycoside hydrolase family 25 protein [Amycolatopsis sp. HUAS 11-8]WAL69275.1 glycoside hydrolase family 25 protein [Amycolatopsis sp. HUAS 11-8]